MEPAIQQLIDAIKQASPYVWHVAYRQVFVDAGVGAVWSIGMLLAGLYCFKLARRIVVPKGILSSDGPAVAKVFSVIGAAVFGFVGFYFLLDNIEEVLNPGYSAIIMIIELTKH